jgi:hypothetical protein
MHRIIAGLNREMNTRETNLVIQLVVCCKNCVGSLDSNMSINIKEKPRLTVAQDLSGAPRVHQVARLASYPLNL